MRFEENLLNEENSSESAFFGSWWKDFLFTLLLRLITHRALVNIFIFSDLAVD